jgi:hypothetical protein
VLQTLKFVYLAKYNHFELLSYVTQYPKLFIKVCIDISYIFSQQRAGYHLVFIKEKAHNYKMLKWDALNPLSILLSPSTRNLGLYSQQGFPPSGSNSHSLPNLELVMDTIHQLCLNTQLPDIAEHSGVSLLPNHPCR